METKSFVNSASDWNVFYPFNILLNKPEKKAEIFFIFCITYGNDASNI